MHDTDQEERCLALAKGQASFLIFLEADMKKLMKFFKRKSSPTLVQRIRWVQILNISGDKK